MRNFIQMYRSALASVAAFLQSPLASFHSPKFSRALSVAATFAFVSVLAFSGTDAFAGTQGSDVFGDAYNQVAGFTQGFLGKLVTLLMIVTGLIMGIARQSIMSLVVGVGMGIALYNAPTVVSQLVGAVL